jgi:hypothetical protein
MYVDELTLLNNPTISLQLITNDERCTREIKCRIAMAKAAFNNKKTFHQQTELKFKEETYNVIHLEHSFVWC